MSHLLTTLNNLRNEVSFHYLWEQSVFVADQILDIKFKKPRTLSKMCVQTKCWSRGRYSWKLLSCQFLLSHTWEGYWRHFAQVWTTTAVMWYQACWNLLKTAVVKSSGELWCLLYKCTEHTSPILFVLCSVSIGCGDKRGKRFPQKSVLLLQCQRLITARNTFQTYVLFCKYLLHCHYEHLKLNESSPSLKEYSLRSGLPWLSRDLKHWCYFRSIVVTGLTLTL